MVQTAKSRRTWRADASGSMLGLACLAAPLLAVADEQPTVTPYRPSVSTPAALSAPGWLELEAGPQFDRGRASARSSSLPYTLKLAFTPDWGVRLSGAAWVRQTDESGQTVSGVGDSSIIVKRRFAVDDTSAFGLEGGVTLPTGNKDVSNGKADYAVNGIYSADLGDYHTDLNLAATRVGAIDAGVGRLQTLWAASLSRPFNDRWGVVGEFSGTRQHGMSATRQFLVAASYNASKSMTLDAGMAHSLRTGDWSVFWGLTVLAGRVF